MSDTGTDWAATATEIEGFSCTNWECDHHECKFLRAAAVGLRRLAQLEAAIERHRTAHVTEGHPGDEPWSCCNDDRLLWAAAVAEGAEDRGQTDG